jgi:prepilin-type N-terminal cleavage/methylation domain-containing protein
MIRRQNNRGVTFLEIMVVLVILGIMMALVLPNLSGPRAKMALKTGAKELAAAGIYARQRAIVSGQETYLIITPPEDEEGFTWRIHTSPPDEDEDYERWLRDLEPQTSEEQPRELPERVDFDRIEVEYEEMDLDDEQRLVFYPNGTCSGMAIQLKNNRDRSLTIDFERASAMPSVYTGEPKSLAQKLRDSGLNPADYGIYDDSIATTSRSTPGEGYYLSAGMTEEERVDYYKGIADRIAEKSQTQYRVKQEGPGVYYSEASRWGN